MGKRLHNGDLSFLPVPLVSSVNNQSELTESLLVDRQCLYRIIKGNFNSCLSKTLKKRQKVTVSLRY